MTLATVIVLVLLGVSQAPESVAVARSRTVSVNGVVADAEGKPLAGAGVFLTGLQTVGGWPPVLARATTDASGKFRLDAPADIDDPAAPAAAALWAVRPGLLVASRVLRPGTLPAGLPVRLVLGPPARGTFEVVGPDGKPVAGARVIPRAITRDATAAPDALGSLIAATTDGEGRAVVTAFFPEEIATVFVQARGLGVQQFGFRGSGVEPKAVALLPVGRVKGRVMADDAAEARALPLVVASFHPKQPSPAAGLFHIPTSAEGRFEIDEVPEGRLSVAVVPRPGSPWFGQMENQPQVVVGKTAEVTLKLVRGVRIRGIVRERGTGKPIAGVGVSLGLGVEPVRTDAEGRYEGFAPPGRRLLYYVWSTPSPYASLLFGLPEVEIPAKVTEFALPAIELARATSLRGSVVDGDGKPVVSASVRALWDVNEGPKQRGRREVETSAGPRGEFVIQGAPLGAEVRLSAHYQGLQTDQPARVLVRAEPGAQEPPLVLKLGSGRAVAVEGRVVDPQGKPIPGALVRLRTKDLDENGQVEGLPLVDFDGLYTLRTDPQGRFRTPPYLDRDGQYAALVQADGYLPGQAPWVAGQSGRFADVVLKPDR
ncbi:MAG: carboxypeptidase regulatory-like domain-containing protein [Isosphaeraceae bacterium]|nr:carboxypeptidase regulatory-like domain-containing protein [Isosphaeraceae bacterium]